MNATVGDGELIVHHYVDLGIAVDLDYEGLLVPVIRDADAKRLRAIAREIYDLATPGPIAEAVAGRDPRRHLHDLQQRLGTARVLTAPIINQPQVAIISTDAHQAPPGRGRLRRAAERRSSSTRSATSR